MINMTIKELVTMIQRILKNKDMSDSNCYRSYSQKTVYIELYESYKNHDACNRIKELLEQVIYNYITYQGSSEVHQGYYKGYNITLEVYEM